MTGTTILRCVAMFLLFLLYQSLALAYGEDVNRDGVGGNDTNAAHWHLTRAMAVCYGFTPGDAKLIADANQATDDGRYSINATITFPNEFTRRQKNSANGCDAKANTVQKFHFPETDDLENTKNWALGITGLLNDDNAPEFVDSTLYCNTGSSPQTVICASSAPYTCSGAGDSVDGGTLESLGIALHSIGDHYSHKLCLSRNYRSHNRSDIACDNSHHTREWGSASAVQSGYRQAKLNNCLDSNGDGVVDTVTVNSVTEEVCASTPYTDDALDGLKAVRDFLAQWAGAKGYKKCTDVRNGELIRFAQKFTSGDRVNVATNIYNSCLQACGLR